MKLLLFLFFFMPISLFAAAPGTSCPSGYVAVSEVNITIATSCPTGTVSAGTAESCLVSSPAGSCIMYAPAGVAYTDSKGTYKFTEPCAMQ